MALPVTSVFFSGNRNVNQISRAAEALLTKQGPYVEYLSTIKGRLEIVMQCLKVIFLALDNNVNEKWQEANETAESQRNKNHRKTIRE